MNTVDRISVAQVGRDQLRIPTFTKQAKRYHDEYAKLIKKARNGSAKAKQKTYEEKGRGPWRLARDMSSNFAAPMTAVRRCERGPNGEAKGTVATQPREVDSIVRKIYGKIYAGNSNNQAKLAKDYMREYDRYIYKAPEATMEDMTGDDLQTSLAHAKETAAGMDQFAPGDFKLLPMVALDHLADLFNIIEKGGRWPQQMEKARAAFMAKDEDDPLNPLAYPVLLMLPSAYFLWTRTRLRHMQPWVAQWATDEMFAGVEGQGAADAAYVTSLLLEHCTLHNIPFSGGAADIYKCFDQLSRPLIYDLIKAAGMPKRIAEPYQKFLEGLMVHNSLGGSLGEAYGKPTGIPREILFR